MLLRTAGVVAAVAASLLWGAQDSPALNTRIAVVTSSAVAAYNEALEGLKLGLGEGAQSLVVVDLRDGHRREDFARRLDKTMAGVAITIGTDATNALASQPNSIPFISTMVLGSQTMKARRTTAPRQGCVGAVTLDVSVTSLLTELKRVFPGKTRLGLLRNPTRAGPSLADLRSQVQRAGFTLWTAEAAAPEQLLEAFHSLKGQVDFVWCLPDASLYTSATVKPLVMASLRNRLPIIGFSSGFVRAGAVVGVYPDFRDVGRQTAEMVRQYLVGHRPLGAQNPRKVNVAINQRAFRILGLQLPSPRGNSDSFVIFK
jgi:ABC-type uncharacterized transport system substrate-binding protein